MTLSEALISAYAAADAHAPIVLAVGVAVPIVGTAAAWIGRGGRTDRDGRFLANLTIAFGLLAFALQIVAIGIARAAFDARLLDANALLLLAPPLTLALALVGVRVVFPLDQLGVARSARAAVLLFLLVLALVWVFGQFRGWGVVFFGSVAQLVALGALAWLLLRRLARSATGRDGAEARTDGAPRRR